MKIIFIFLICLLLFSFVSSESPNLLDGTQGLPSLDTASLSNNTYNIIGELRYIIAYMNKIDRIINSYKTRICNI
jgi:hypothetical protein